MHPEAKAGLDHMINVSGIDRYAAWDVLDLGGRDVNGSIRGLLPNSRWKGVDISAGEGVDLVHDCTKPWPDDFPKFDLVVSTEVLEHVMAWRELLKVCGQAMNPMSIQTLFITCASTGRRPHGATGAMDPAPGEWYNNVAYQDLSDELENLYRHFAVTYNPNPGDAYAWASGVRPTW